MFVVVVGTVTPLLVKDGIWKWGRWNCANTCCQCCVWWEVVVPYTCSFLFHKVCFQCIVEFSSFAWISLIHLLLSQLHISITYFFASLGNIPESSILLFNPLLPHQTWILMDWWFGFGIHKSQQDTISIDFFMPLRVLSSCFSDHLSLYGKKRGRRPMWIVKVINFGYCKLSW